MTGGIGNPDWQRRYTTSAAPLYTGSFADDASHFSGVNDSNGYQYLLVSTNDPGASTFKFIQIIWWQDAAGTLEMGFTDWTVPPNTFELIKVPILTRYYMVQITPVGGASGTNTSVVVYGTNADQENTLAQNTATPQAYFSGTVAAGAKQTTLVNGIFGGEAMISIDYASGTTWTEWIDYYDWNSQAYKTIWTARGPDKGSSYAERIFLPYAPLRLIARNDGTSAELITQALICP